MAPGSVMPRSASAIWPAPRYSSTFSTTARYSRASSRARSDGVTSSSTGSTCTQRALPVDAAALLGRGATPDAVGLAVPDGVVEALGAHRAGGADRQGLGLLVGRDRIEDLGVSAAAGGLSRPGSLLHDRNNAAWEGAIS